MENSSSTGSAAFGCGLMTNHTFHPLSHDILIVTYGCVASLARVW